MLSLVRPDVAYHESWLASAAEFTQAGDYQHGSGLAPANHPVAELRGTIFRPEDLADPQRFAAFVAEMRSRADRAVAERIGLVPDSKLWIVRDDTYLGSLSLRHELNDFLWEEGGHIGYAVRPTARRQGVATGAVALALPIARDLGITRVLITCDDDNEASARTIEANGGVLEDIRNGKRRYWIDIA